MGLGSELLLVLLLGFLILGPKQMHALLGRVAHAKTEFDKVIRSFKSQVGAEFEVPSQSLEN